MLTCSNGDCYETQRRAEHSRFLIEASCVGESSEPECAGEECRTAGTNAGVRKTAGHVVEVRPSRHMTRRFAAVAALVLIAGAAHAQPSTIILVRHAEKAPTPAVDPPLTSVGQQRARDLATALADAHVSTILATQFQRTQATARPLAELVGQTMIIVPATTDPDAHAEAVAAKARSAPAGSIVLIVGHSNTVPLIISALGGPKMEELCDREYSDLFVLEMSASGAPHLIRGRYGAADPPRADKCSQTMRQP